MTMFSWEHMQEWEARTVSLNDQGESEAYFPLWGIVDVDDYLQKSSGEHSERASSAPVSCAAAASALSASSAQDQCSELCAGETPANNSFAATDITPLPLTGCPSKRARITWGVFFWVQRVVVTVLICLVGSLLITMAMNPSITFFQAIEVLFQGITGAFNQFIQQVT